MTEQHDDLETRLAAVLRAQTAGTPRSTDLAAAARRLNGTRRRNLLLTVATMAAVVVAITTTIVLVGGNPDRPSSPSPAPPASFDGTDWIPDGFRAESYDGIEIAVPEDWRYGDLSQWCVPEDHEAPVFDRPGGISTLVGCIGPGGYGVQFLQTGETDLEGAADREFPDDAAVRSRSFDHLRVLVVVRGETLADQIIGTAHEIVGLDTAGCAGSEQLSLARTPDLTPDEGGPISVCRYDVHSNRASLVQSELLSPSDSESARAALDAAPEARPARCSAENGAQGEVVLLRTAEGPLAWVHTFSCLGTVVEWDGTVRKLTPDVLHWAYSPGWSGVVPDGVNFRLRTFR